MECKTFRQPSPTSRYTCINIGDVGFIRDGQFHWLFSAGSELGSRVPGADVPRTFRPLDIGDPVVVERLPGCLHTSTIQLIGPRVYRGFTPMYVPFVTLSSAAFIDRVPPRSEENEANFTFQLTGDCGAALVSRHSTRQTDSQDDLRPRFEKYTKRHYKSWVQFARDRYPHLQEIKPILVSGFDVTSDFAAVSYSNDLISVPSLQVSSNPFTKPMFRPTTPPPFHGKWRYKYPPYFNDGRSDSTEPNQCVFIRYYTMRFKGIIAKRVPDRIRAGLEMVQDRRSPSQTV
jgi:hypothetical protein